MFVNTDLELRKLAENIKIARKRRKLSISALAVKASVSKTVMSRIESGDPSVGVGKVLNVLDALGLLKGISELADPDRDREQALKEIEALRESRVKPREVSKIKRPKSNLVRFMGED